MDTTIVDTALTVIENPELVMETVEQGSAVWNFILDNLGELVIGLLAFVKIIVNITPTEKDNQVFGWLDALINMIIADRKKA